MPFTGNYAPVVGSGGGGGLSEGDVNALIDARNRNLAGLELTLARTSYTGDGTDHEFTLSHALTLTNGGRYYISDLVITVRKAVGDALVCAIPVDDQLATYSTTGPTWSDVVRGATNPELGADVLDYFARADADAGYQDSELPGLYYNAGALKIAAPVLNGMAVKIQAKGRIAFYTTTL